MNNTLGKIYSKELASEAPASRKCLERYKEELFDYKPHEKAMQMGYLALMTAEIPRWITTAIKEGVVDFATWKSEQFKTGEDLVKILDKNMEDALETLEKADDKEFDETFTLRNGEQVLMTSTKAELVSSTINHWVHHRGQLTVYMKLKDIPIPSIYGPSADDKTF